MAIVLKLFGKEFENSDVAYLKERLGGLVPQASLLQASCHAHIHAHSRN